MKLSARYFLWVALALPLLTFSATFPISYEQKWVAGPVTSPSINPDPICSRPLRTGVAFLSDSLDYGPGSNVGMFGLSITVALAALLGLARHEQVKARLRCAETCCAASAEEAGQEARSSSLLTPEHVLKHHSHEDHVSGDDGKEAATEALESLRLLVKHLRRLNAISLVIGGIALLGALGVASVQQHASDAIHMSAAVAFFGGVWLYACICCHIDRRLTGLAGSADAASRRRAVIQIILCVTISFSLVAAVALSYFSPSEMSLTTFPLLRQLSAVFEIAAFLLMLSFFLTWDAAFKPMTIAVGVTIVEDESEVAPATRMQSTVSTTQPTPLMTPRPLASHMNPGLLGSILSMLGKDPTTAAVGDAFRVGSQDDLGWNEECLAVV